MKSDSKIKIEHLALFGGKPLFDKPVSTSCLAKPSHDRFLSYSAKFFAAGQYTNNGPLVKELEARLAEFHKAEYCISFCSGFWALALAIQTLMLPEKSEIIMPSLTYRRMADLAAWNRLKPRFCEIDPSTLALDVNSVSDCITENTALILGVHPIVNTCDVSGLQVLSDQHGIPLLIDSVESVFEYSAEGRVGSIAKVEAFSLHASKLINGAEGGYITTNDIEISHKLQALRGFGFVGPDKVAFEGGMNAKLNEMHAALALANLDELDALVQKNRINYRVYQSRMSRDLGLRLVEFDERYPTSYKNILVKLDSAWPLTRKLTLKILEAEKILARAYYSPALHQKTMIYQHIPATLPITEELAEKFILLPSGFMVGNAQIEDVMDLLEYVHENATAIKKAYVAQEAFNEH